MKRILPLLLCVLLLIPVLAVTVSADTSYSFEYQYVEMLDEWYFVYPGILPDGEYNITFYGQSTSMVTKAPFSVKFEWMEDRGTQLLVSLGTTTLVQFPSEITVDVSLVQLSGHTYLMGELEELDADVRILFSRAGSDDTPVASVSDSLNTAIEWVGTVTTSLLSGELNGLLLLAAIPIAITVVMLSIKFIRKNSWGC